MSFQIRLLGSPQILIDGRDAGVTRRKSRAVLYYLAVQPHPILRQQLLSIFWVDQPRLTAMQTLRTTLHGLRRVLGEALEAQGDRLALAESVFVDGREFEQRLNSLPPGLKNLTSVLELYRGEFLESFTLAGVQPFEDWLTVTREHYRRLAVRGWTALAEHHESQRQYRQALDSLERALALDRLQEDLQRDVIRLMVLAGDRPAAIRRYDELRRLLDDEMGVPPMVETRRLYDDILNDRLAAPQEPPVVLGAAVPAPRATAGFRAAMLPLRPAPPIALSELPFSGRLSELEALAAATAAARLALIEGEAGVGKTRLAEKFLAGLVENHTALPLVSRGRELEQALPYLPVIEALRQLLACPDWPELRTDVLYRTTPVWVAEVSRLLPELDPSQPTVSTLPAEEARLWEGVRRFLQAVAGLRPLALLIDDLQWVDASSLGLLGYLLRHNDACPIRYMATLRTGARSQPAAALIQSLQRDDRLQRIPLERLSSAEVLAISRKVAPADAEVLSEWLYSTSEGNPYILAEIVRHARKTGLVLPDGRVNLPGQPGDSVLPQTVFSLIQSRLEPLSESARRVLDAAVAQGREFEFKVVAHAAGLSESAALDALDELQASGLVLPLRGEWFRFDHPLTMEAAYQDVGDFRHRRLHLRVAEALEHLYLDRLDEVAGQLAWHYFEGQDPQHAARFALQAARRSADLAAWTEAIRFYEMALGGLPASQQLPALTALGEAYGQAGNTPRASEILGAALHQAESDPSIGLGAGHSLDRLRLALGRVLLVQGRFAEVIELSRRVIEIGSPESAIEAQVLWGTALSIEGADMQAAAERLQAAQELWYARRGADPSALAMIQFELGSVAAQQGDLPGAVAYYRQSLSTAQQAEGPDAIQRRLLGYNNLAYHLHLLGDPSAAGFADTGLDIANEKGMLGMLTYLHSTRGEIALAAGDLEAAESHFNAGLELAERFSIQERIAGITANQGLLAAARGQSPLAIYLLSKALGQADTLGTRHQAAQIRIWLAPLLPPGEARRRLAEARHFAESSGRRRLIDEVERIQSELSLE